VPNRKLFSRLKNSHDKILHVSKSISSALNAPKEQKTSNLTKSETLFRLIRRRKKYKPRFFEKYEAENFLKSLIVMLVLLAIVICPF